MTEENVVVATFDGFCRSAGYVKRSGSWYSRSDETICLLNLQKSRYGPSYYMNYGIWILELADATFPKPNTSHIIGRLDDFVTDEDPDIAAILDLSVDLSDEHRQSALLKALVVDVLPLLNAAATLQGLQTGFARPLVDRGWAYEPADELFAD
ncbi:MAG: hypothetical protein JWQ47_1971 [Glaciihabitans sp.]|nr:hypothetical protein [Glaciihabitans sp.]